MSVLDIKHKIGTLINKEDENMTKQTEFDLNAIKDEKELVLLNAYLESVLYQRAKVVSAETIQDIYDSIASYVVNPVVLLAKQQMLQGEEPTVLMSLAELNEKHIEEDLMMICEAVEFASPNDFDVKRILSDINEYIHAMSESDDNVHVRAYCHDIYKLREDANGTYVADKDRRKFKFREKMSSMIHCASKEANMIETMRKYCRDLDDMEMWLSRYFVNPAVDLYSEGDLYALKTYAQRRWKDVLREAIYVAKQCGFSDVTEENFDLDSIMQATYNQCEQRTGYCLLPFYYHECLHKESVS